MKDALYVSGAVVELLGIILVASPDLLPGALRLSRWIRLNGCGLENRVRRVLHLPLRLIVHDDVPVAGTITVSGRVAATRSTTAKTADEQIKFLLRRDQEAQRDLDELADRVMQVEEELVRVDQALRGIPDRVNRQIAAAQADYRAARVIGVLLLVVGLGLGTGGNLYPSRP